MPTVYQRLDAISQGCAILSDLATNGSYFAIGRLVDILGLHREVPEEERIDIDEDFIYRRIHPEDLVDKRMLELRYFEKAADLSAEERLKFHATCRIRMQKASGDYIYIHNVTRVQQNDADGLMRLVTCLYELSPDQNEIRGINPHIVNVETGEVQQLALYEERFKSSLLVRRKSCYSSSGDCSARRLPTRCTSASTPSTPTVRTFSRN